MPQLRYAAPAKRHSTARHSLYLQLQFSLFVSLSNLLRQSLTSVRTVRDTFGTQSQKGFTEISPVLSCCHRLYSSTLPPLVFATRVRYQRPIRTCFHQPCKAETGERLRLHSLTNVLARWKRVEPVAKPFPPSMFVCVLNR